MFNLKSLLFSILILAMLPSANANDAGTYIRFTKHRFCLR